MNRGRSAMKASGRLVASFASLPILLLSSLALAASEKATPLDAVADTRDMAPGFIKFLADTYNGNLYVFGLYVVLIMAGMGAGLGLAIDRVISLLGIDLGRMDHRE